jgi:hypothetical protein
MLNWLVNVPSLYSFAVELFIGIFASMEDSDLDRYSALRND